MGIVGPLVASWSARERWHDSKYWRKSLHCQYSWHTLARSTTWIRVVLFYMWHSTASNRFPRHSRHSNVVLKLSVRWRISLTCTWCRCLDSDVPLCLRNQIDIAPDRHCSRSAFPSWTWWRGSIGLIQICYWRHVVYIIGCHIFCVQFLWWVYMYDILRTYVCMYTCF